MSQQITHGDDSRQAMLRNINSLANAVRVTLGPRGRNVLLGVPFGAPTITKDGATASLLLTTEAAIASLPERSAA